MQILKSIVRLQINVARNILKAYQRLSWLLDTNMQYKAMEKELDKKKIETEVKDKLIQINDILKPY